MATTTMQDAVIEHNGHVIKGENQQIVLKMVKKRPVMGYTAREIEDAHGLDHGKVSGALSLLHKKGIISLLNEKRNGFRIYVLSEHIKGREVKARKS